jgi:ubiquinone/menaquinone biosynthesis C-methylase UbiE
MKTRPEQIQAEYYKSTAALYDAMHVEAPDQHLFALQMIEALSETLGLKTFLDVGAGTGRGVRYLLERGKTVRGIEPVQELIDEGVARGVPREVVTRGTGYRLPYRDMSFDAVFECGVLHHVAEPSKMVDEMTRVARRAVFISDANRFGQGRLPVRLLKLALYKAGLWRAARFLRTGGKMYTISEGDGLAYSYSVFDSYFQLDRWANQVLLLPTSSDVPRCSSWLNPLITAPDVLLCGLKTGGCK